MEIRNAVSVWEPYPGSISSVCDGFCRTEAFSNFKGNRTAGRHEDAPSGAFSKFAVGKTFRQEFDRVIAGGSQPNCIDEALVPSDIGRESSNYLRELELAVLRKNPHNH